MKRVRNVCRKNYYEYLTHIQESKYAGNGFCGKHYMTIKGYLSN